MFFDSEIVVKVVVLDLNEKLVHIKDIIFTCNMVLSDTSRGKYIVKINTTKVTYSEKVLQ